MKLNIALLGLLLALPLSAAERIVKFPACDVGYVVAQIRYKFNTRSPENELVSIEMDEVPKPGSPVAIERSTRVWNAASVAALPDSAEVDGKVITNDVKAKLAATLSAATVRASVMTEVATLVADPKNAWMTVELKPVDPVEPPVITPIEEPKNP